MKTKKQLEKEIEENRIKEQPELLTLSGQFAEAELEQTNEIIKLIENFPTQTLRKRTTLDEEDVFDVIIKKEILTKLRGGEK